MLRDKNGLTEEEFLASYDASLYERPSVTVDIVLVCEGRLLLIRRNGHPSIGKRALPGGFVEPDETVPQAAKRELFEETNVSDVALKQLRVWSEPKRDPRTRIITVSFLAHFLHGEKAAVAGDDASDARWFDYFVNKGDDVFENGFKKNRFDITLTSGNEIIRYSVEQTTPILPFACDSEYTLLSDCSIASDHPLIIADALDKIIK